MRADYHVHSEFSDDSSEPIRNQVRRGIELGLDEICLTDHVDYGIKKDWTDGEILWRKADPNLGGADMPLANVDYPAYFHCLKEMQQEYDGQIRLRKGLEFGIQLHTVQRYQKLFDTWKDELDFILLSVHQIDDKELWNQDYQRGKSQREYQEAYYQEILKTQKCFRDYSVLAHLDLISRYDEKGIYPFEKIEIYVSEILKQAIRDGKGIELNTSSWKYGLRDTQPGRKILKLYRDLGGKIITIGSDAHDSAHVADHLEEGMRILKEEIGFTEICTFEKMQPVFHAL